MRAGADAEVVAEAPVIEVVRALAPIAGIGADLVLGEPAAAGGAWQSSCMSQAPSSSGIPAGGAGGERDQFQRQLVDRLMWVGCSAERAFDVPPRHRR